MAVFAIDVSMSIRDKISVYRDKIFDIALQLKPPITAIYWNTEAKVTTFDIIDRQLVNFRGHGEAIPQRFIEKLPTNKKIDLYIFTDGSVTNSDSHESLKLLKQKQLIISNVKLYYIGNTAEMNLKFIDIFKGISREVNINGDAIGKIPASINFDSIDLNYIEKDESFKLSVLALINSGTINKEILKNTVWDLLARIMKDHFNKEVSVGSFCENQDIQGCANYIANYSNYANRLKFQNKIADVFSLFTPKTNTHSLNLFNEKVTKLIYTKPEIDCKRIKYNSLFENHETLCLIVKKITRETAINMDDYYWNDPKEMSNPFMLLDCQDARMKITRLVEPYILNFKAYKKMSRQYISPFTEDKIQGMYLLNNGSTNILDLIHHNNSILNCLFQNYHTGSYLLYHFMFLYIVATEKLPNMKHRLFHEIRTLSKHFYSLITLCPTLNPGIIDTYEVSFWYIANVSPLEIAGKEKNVLRAPKFNATGFLKFYTDVYNKEYLHPKDIALWEFWKKLCTTGKENIITILTNYFNYEIYGDQIVLFQGEEKKEPLTEMHFLPDLNSLLNLYKKFIETTSPNYYDSVHLEEKHHLEISNLLQRDTGESISQQNKSRDMCSLCHM